MKTLREEAIIADDCNQVLTDVDPRDILSLYKELDDLREYIRIWQIEKKRVDNKI